MTIDKNEFEKQAASLIFHIFIYISDIEEGLTPEEVQDLTKMLENPSWTNNEKLRKALSILRVRYSEMWSDYHEKRLAINLDTVTEHIRMLMLDLDDDGKLEFKSALEDCIKRISSSQVAVAQKNSLGKAKFNARRDVANIIDKCAKNAQVADGLDEAPQPSPSDPLPRDATQHINTMWHPTELPGIWEGGKTLLTCVNITSETADVKTFTFESLPRQLFSYEPGQFITLELSVEGRVMRRSYTISSSPTRPYCLSITVKRVRMGWISNWLHDNLNVGDEVKVNGPTGKFSHLQHPSNKLLLVGGGSGITPIMSMLRWICDTSSPLDVILINSVRTPADIIFEKELSLIQQRLGNSFKLVIMPSGIPRGQAWAGMTGRLNCPLLQCMVPDISERETFVCGPPGFMEFIKNILLSAGLPESKYHQESFGSAPPPKKTSQPLAPPESVIAKSTLSVVGESNLKSERSSVSEQKNSELKNTPRQGSESKLKVNTQTQSVVGNMALSSVSEIEECANESPAPAIESAKKSLISFEQSGTKADCYHDDYILDVAETHGVEIPNSCRAGTCGTCKVMKLEGNVDMSNPEALTDSEVQDGYILPCVTKAQGKVVIDI